MHGGVAGVSGQPLPLCRSTSFMLRRFGAGDNRIFGSSHTPKSPVADGNVVTWEQVESELAPRFGGPRPGGSMTI
jgi:hypothetical protein